MLLAVTDPIQEEGDTTQLTDDGQQTLLGASTAASAADSAALES